MPKRPQLRRPQVRAAVIVAATVATIAGCTSSPSASSSSGPASGTVTSGASAAGSTGATATATAATKAPTVIVLDASSSMLQSDAPGARIAAARSAVSTLEQAIPAGTPVGVVVFGNKVGDAERLKSAGCRDISTLVPLATTGRAGIPAAVATVAARGWTPLAAALQSAAALLPATGKQNIVLLTDGADTCEPAGPCPVARTLHSQRPDLTVHTVAFKADAAARAALTCVAGATGGVAVDAANTAQLSARIGATADPGRVTTSLTGSGYRGLTIGMTAADAAAAYRDFPAVAATGTVRVVYVDCTLTFVDGALTEIAPRTDVPTLDGLHRGDDVSRAATLYGAGTPQAGNGGSVVVLAAGSGDTGYRITYQPSGEPTSLVGTITTIVLCRCRPVAPVQPGHGDWHSSRLIATASTLGAARIDMTESQLKQATGVSSFRMNPDYADVAVGTRGLTVGDRLSGPSGTMCFGAVDEPGAPTVATDMGITFGDTAKDIEAAYGSAAKSVIGSASQGSTVPGYLIRGIAGSLFLAMDGNGGVASINVLGPKRYVGYCV